MKAAVPFLVPNVPVCLKATKPELLVGADDDLARHLRRHRKELGIFQSDAGRIMGVCKASVWNWENRRAEPEDYLYPAIIRFLGREPWPEPQTLAEHLRAERKRRGITIQAAAMLMKVSHGALANWEDGTANPNQINLAGVIAFLGQRTPRRETG